MVRIFKGIDLPQSFLERLLPGPLFFLSLLIALYDMDVSFYKNLGTIYVKIVANKKIATDA